MKKPTGTWEKEYTFWSGELGIGVIPRDKLADPHSLKYFIPIKSFIAKVEAKAHNAGRKEAIEEIIDWLERNFNVPSADLVKVFKMLEEKNEKHI